MKLSFACESCGTKFNVAPELAGRPCRCNKCGHRFTIPAAAGVPELVGAGVGSAAPQARPAAPTPPQPPMKKPPAPAAAMMSQRVLQSIQSQIALAPVSTDRLRAVAAKKHDDFTLSDRAPYQLAEPVPVTTKKKKFRPAKAVKRTYSNELRKLQKWFRYFNELGLELTVPFFVLIPFGFLLQRGSWSQFGAVMVLVINVLRLGFGVANILVIPFRESPLQGLLFFVPPWSYLRKHWEQFSRPFGRVASPIAFILGVLFLYAFMPAWVGHKPPNKVKPTNLKGQPAEQEESGFKVPTVQDLKKQVQKGAEALKGDITGQMKQAQELSTDKLQDVGNKAAEEFNKAKDQIQKQLDSTKEAAPPSSPK